MRNRIHVSQATADELERQNKETWLDTRGDKIQAKGKGEMQTYWINLMGISQSKSDTSLSMKDPAHDVKEQDHGGYQGYEGRTSNGSEILF